jgi:hypothetical protein
MARWRYVGSCVINETKRKFCLKMSFCLANWLVFTVICESPLFCNITKKSFENIASYKYLSITVMNQSYIQE